jgi:hypothetical protein
MFQGSTSIVIIGADFSQRGPARRAEIAACQPGEDLELRRERAIVGGHAAVGIYSARGVQIGYIWPEAADLVAGQIAVARAIFYTAEAWGAVARITLDGSSPAVPQPKPKPHINYPPRPLRDEYCGIFPNLNREGGHPQRTPRHSDKTRRAAGAMGEQMQNLSEDGLKRCEKMRP